MRRNRTRKMSGGQCGSSICQLGGSNQRVGVMNPTWGGNRRKSQKGKGCPCQAVPQIPTPLKATQMGGYKATKRNLKYLKLWKKGKSIGFTMRSSLKAKGLIPRKNGSYRVSPKYHR